MICNGRYRGSIGGDVTRSRMILPGSVCFVTSETVGRLFRLVPNRRTVAILDFCLRAAARDFEGKIRLHEFFFMSNHVHLLLTDVAGVLPKFMALLDSLISRNLNQSRGITGRNFEGYSCQVIDQDDLERQVEAAVYTLNNAAASHLVTRSRQWKSATSLRLKYGVPSSRPKPAVGIWSSKLRHLRSGGSRRSGRAHYAGRSKYRDRESLTLHPLPGFEGDPSALRRRILTDLRRAEDALIQLRHRENIGVLGFQKAKSEHFNAMPSSGRVLFDRNPRYAASTPERRAALRKRFERFDLEYGEARDRFKAGERDVKFPTGTWMMVQRLNVQVAAPGP